VTATFSAGDFGKAMLDPTRDLDIFVRAIASPGADTSGTLTIQY
jgi:hypothetical protein